MSDNRLQLVIDSLSNFDDDQIVQDSNQGCKHVVQLQLGGRIFFQASKFDSWPTVPLWKDIDLIVQGRRNRGGMGTMAPQSFPESV